MHISKAFRSYLDLIVGSILLTLGIYRFITDHHSFFKGCLSFFREGGSDGSHQFCDQYSLVCVWLEDPELEVLF